MGNRDAMEALKWHEKLFKQHWTEPRPASLVMTDTEILDWLNEYCEQVVWNRATPQHNEEFTIYCDGIKTSGSTLREATTLASAKYEEINL